MSGAEIYYYGYQCESCLLRAEHDKGGEYMPVSDLQYQMAIDARDEALAALAHLERLQRTGDGCEGEWKEAFDNAKAILAKYQPHGAESEGVK
jgi:hypothetical protein